MDPSSALLWGAIVVGAAALIYAIHRLCLWLEKRGWLYYKHKQPGSSPLTCMTGLQEVLEPQTRHVIHVKDEKRVLVDEATPGADDPPAMWKKRLREP